jgi:hypothetical protein
MKLGINHIAVAGMDGFSDNPNDNFADRFMEMYGSPDSLTLNNAMVKHYLENLQECLNLTFVTPSIFNTAKESD